MLAPGTLLSRYVVEAPMGSGGMGTVYRARDTHLDRPVALKVLSDEGGGLPDREARERLIREARAAAALSHPNAVALFDAGDSEHGPFIVMELVEGETLRVAMGREIPVSDLVAWMTMAALALAEAHDRGIVHRDIKPENLMIRKDGIAKVLDFGIARQSQRALDASAPTQPALPTLTGTGVQIGTPQYMAPEQIKGAKVDGRTDQFAWAVTAYEALAGKLPWSATNGPLGVVAAILEETPPDVSTLRAGVPAHVGRAIAKAMSKRPDDRFATMRDLVRALEGATVAEPAPTENPMQSRAAPAPAAPFQTRYGSATVKAVIGKALSLEQQGGYSKSELREAAEELGIGEAALEEAAVAVREERAQRALAQRHSDVVDRIVHRRRRAFINHFIAYIGVNMVIMMPALMRGMYDKIWAFTVPGILWGIGLVIHALNAFSKHVEPREIRREIEREERALSRDAVRRAALASKLEKQARREQMKKDAVAVGHAVEEGVAAILDIAARRVRDGADRAANAAEHAARRTQASANHAAGADPGVRVRADRPRVNPTGRSASAAEREAEAEAEQAERDAGRRRS
ncbi:MAG: protein kinase [Polyangiaceae bacterium]